MVTANLVGGTGVLGDVDAVTLVLEDILEQDTNIGLVIDYQDTARSSSLLVCQCGG